MGGGGLDLLSLALLKILEGVCSQALEILAHFQSKMRILLLVFIYLLNQYSFLDLSPKIEMANTNMSIVSFERKYSPLLPYEWVQEKFSITWRGSVPSHVMMDFSCCLIRQIFLFLFLR